MGLIPNGYEAWYKIIDKNTIESLVYSNWGKITKETAEKLNNNVVNKSDYYAKFIPCDTLPDPNKARIKKDKYFWCNKEQYKKWKKEQKMQKHKNK